MPTPGRILTRWIIAMLAMVVAADLGAASIARALDQGGSVRFVGGEVEHDLELIELGEDGRRDVVDGDESHPDVVGDERPATVPAGDARIEACRLDAGSIERSWSPTATRGPPAPRG